MVRQHRQVARATPGLTFCSPFGLLLIQRGAKATSLSPTLIQLLATKHKKPGCKEGSHDKGGREHVLKRKGDHLTEQSTDRHVTGMEKHLSTPSLWNKRASKTHEANQAPHELLALRTRAGSFLYLNKRGLPEIDGDHAPRKNLITTTSKTERRGRQRTKRRSESHRLRTILRTTERTRPISRASGNQPMTPPKERTPTRSSEAKSALEG